MRRLFAFCKSRLGRHKLKVPTAGNVDTMYFWFKNSLMNKERKFYIITSVRKSDNRAQSANCYNGHTDIRTKLSVELATRLK